MDLTTGDERSKSHNPVRETSTDGELRGRSGHARFHRLGRSGNTLLPIRARRRVLGFCIALFVASVGVRLLWQSREFGSSLFADDQQLSIDEHEYDALAKSVLSGDGFRQRGTNQGGFAPVPVGNKPTAFRTPGFPLFLSAIYSIVGVSTHAAAATLLVVTSFLAPVIYLLGLALFDGPVVALAASCIWVLSPSSLRLAACLLGEEISTLLVMLALLMTVVSERRSQSGNPSWKGFLLVVSAGLILGMATLTRGLVIFFPVALAGWLAFRKRNRLAVALLLSAFLLPAAWMGRNATVMGIATLSTETPQTIWLGNNAWARGSWAGAEAQKEEQRSALRIANPKFDELDEIGLYRLFSVEAKRVVLQNPRHVAWLLPRKAFVFFSPKSWMGFDWVFAAALPFALIGLVSLARRNDYRHVFYLMIFCVSSVLLVALLVFGDVRFRHSIEPLIFLVSVFGAEKVWSRRLILRRVDR